MHLQYTVKVKQGHNPALEVHNKKQKRMVTNRLALGTPKVLQRVDDSLNEGVVRASTFLERLE